MLHCIYHDQENWASNLCYFALIMIKKTELHTYATLRLSWSRTRSFTLILHSAHHDEEHWASHLLQSAHHDEEYFELHTRITEGFGTKELSLPLLSRWGWGSRGPTLILFKSHTSKPCCAASLQASVRNSIRFSMMAGSTEQTSSWPQPQENKEWTEMQKDWCKLMHA